MPGLSVIFVFEPVYRYLFVWAEQTRTQDIRIEQIWVWVWPQMGIPLPMSTRINLHKDGQLSSRFVHARNSVNKNLPQKWQRLTVGDVPRRRGIVRRKVRGFGAKNRCYCLAHGNKIQSEVERGNPC